MMTLLRTARGRVVRRIANQAPSLGRYKRVALAAFDRAGPMRKSYAQSGEDQYVAGVLQEYDLSSGVYVDVGANHPTRISNTYLFYRMGLSGVAIEPNMELVRLFKAVRPRDLVICAGANARCEVLRLRVLSAPVLSSFGSDASVVADRMGLDAVREELVPTLPLDMMLEPVSYRWIYMMSIDTEGFECAAIEGAQEALKVSLLLVVEAEQGDGEQRVKEAVASVPGTRFTLQRRIGCNLIFRNESPHLEERKNSQRGRL